MHVVTSSNDKICDEVRDCQDGEYVKYGKTFYRVCHHPGFSPDAVALDRDATIGGGCVVRRLAPGTVITIVVDGEKPQISGNPWIKNRHESDLSESKPQSDAEFLDSLREQGIPYRIEFHDGRIDAYCDEFWAYDERHFRSSKLCDTFAEAVQWLREKVDG